MMKRQLLQVFLSVLVATTAQADVKDAFGGILPVSDAMHSRSLNGEWSLKVIPGISDDKSVPPADDTWGRIAVPGCWEAYGFCEPKYNSPQPLTGYYRTSFAVPKEWRRQRVVVRLDGVLYGYDLWLNGHYVGSWRSAYNTALFDITPYLDLKKEQQQLAMRVITQFRGSDFDCNDDWAPCGIFRDVTLFCVPEIHLKDLTIKADISGHVDVRTEVANADRYTAVAHEILDAEGKVVGNTSVENPRLWTAETPYLYTLRTRLMHKRKTLQMVEHKFGFRQLTIEGNVLKLNGKAVKLRGVTCHSTDPRTAKVVDDTLTLRDMRLMKEASVNYIRTSHYPREPRFYELADSLGFYVIDEVPFGFGDKNLSDTTFYEILQQRAQATVRRDKNHASVLVWSLGNENPLTDICVRLGSYVKQQLDPTRPICYPQVGSYFRKFNYDFPGVADIYAPHYPTTSQIAHFYKNPDRPVIFTEYCHSLGISFEDHDRQWELIEQTPGIAGGSVWEWVDQGMPFTDELTSRYGYQERVFTSTHGGFHMQGNLGTDGLLYADRTPLPNYYELQHNYARAFVQAPANADTICPRLRMESDGTVRLEVVNRFDFLNLKDNVSFGWTLTADRDTLASGSFSPHCEPHGKTIVPLQLPRLADNSRIALLSIEATDPQGYTFLRQSFRLDSTDLTTRLLTAMSQTTGSAEEWMADSMRVRAGRKATMAERLKVADKRLEPYLLRMPAMGCKMKTEKAHGASHYVAELTPDTTDTFLSELGVAFLLNRRIDRVQWIGMGPMPTYPGRYRANRYGFWAMQQGDLYFEGNRMGMDAALLSDAEGNGLLVMCRQGNVSFEQTDQGIVVSVNAAVAGQGPKFARTAFPVVARQVGTVKCDFFLCPVDARTKPQLLRQLFAPASEVPAPQKPFVTQYDTYLMRYADITD